MRVRRAPRGRVVAAPRCDAALSRLALPLAVFTNILKESFLQELADADEGEVIKQVQARPPRVAAVVLLAAAVC